MFNSRMPNRTDWTHVEEVKDPVKILLPSANLVLIALCKDQSGDSTPFTLLDDLLPDFIHGSAIEISVIP